MEINWEFVLSVFVYNQEMYERKQAQAIAWAFGFSTREMQQVCRCVKRLRMRRAEDVARIMEQGKDYGFEEWHGVDSLPGKYAELLEQRKYLADLFGDVF